MTDTSTAGADLARAIDPVLLDRVAAGLAGLVPPGTEVRAGHGIALRALFARADLESARRA